MQYVYILGIKNSIQTTYTINDYNVVFQLHLKNTSREYQAHFKTTFYFVLLQFYNSLQDIDSSNKINITYFKLR